MENDNDTNGTKQGSGGGGGGGGAKANPVTAELEQNPNLDASDAVGEQPDEVTASLLVPSLQSSRTPFTDLSQVEADLALARTLQEQERAYMMLRMNADGSDYGSWEAGSFLHDDEDDYGDPHDNTEADDDDDEEEEEEFDGTDADEDEDAFDVHAHEDGEGENSHGEYDSDAFSSDEAYARHLQDVEDREMAARLLSLAGINGRDAEDSDDQGVNSQDAWEEVDPDELSYEELLALGEVVGSESKGLSADTIASLPSVNYKTGSSQTGTNDLCVICRLDYEDGDTLTVLSCKHSYHSECLVDWLKINKVCPVCSAEVSAAGNS